MRTSCSWHPWVDENSRPATGTLSDLRGDKSKRDLPNIRPTVESEPNAGDYLGLESFTQRPFHLPLSSLRLISAMSVVTVSQWRLRARGWFPATRQNTKNSPGMHNVERRSIHQPGRGVKRSPFLPTLHLPPPLYYSTVRLSELRRAEHQQQHEFQVLLPTLRTTYPSKDRKRRFSCRMPDVFSDIYGPGAPSLIGTSSNSAEQSV